MLAVPGLCFAQGRQLSLDECLEMSRENNPYVKAAALDLSSAKDVRQEALSKYFPEVTARAFGFHALDPLVNIGLSDVLGSSDMANNLKFYLENAAAMNDISTSWSMLGYAWSAGVNVVQPVFAGGRIVNGNALAKLGVAAAGLKQNVAIRDNQNEVTAKYWTVVSLGEKKKALQAGLDLLSTLSKDVASARGAGISADSDVLQVRVKQKELEAQMSKLVRGEKLAKMDLFNAIGLQYSYLGIDEIGLSDSFDNFGAPADYYADAESVAASTQESKLLELQLESKTLEKKMAVGEALPEIGVGAIYGYGKIMNDPRANGAVYASVKIPLSDWGRTARKIHSCDNEISKTLSEKEYLDRQLILKVRKDWMNVECGWEQIEVCKEALGLQETVEAQKEASFKAGLCTMSELLQAQTDLQKARTELVDSRIEYCKAVSEWLRQK